MRYKVIGASNANELQKELEKAGAFEPILMSSDGGNITVILASEEFLKAKTRAHEAAKRSKY